MKVLIADDDAVVRLILAATVAKLGHQPLEAEDGLRAWDLLVEHRPDVLITDLMMPGLDGFELCRRVRERSGEHYTYIVLATARSGRDDVLAGVVAGADDYLVKPVEPFDLQVRLTAAERVTSLHRQVHEASAELQRLNAELVATARTDALTGLGNRRRFDEDLAQIHARARRRGVPYTVAVADIDHFKSYNDRFGHIAGDQTLRAAGQVLREACRRSDAVYRYGGEEFVMLFVDEHLSSVVVAAERARREVEALRHDADGHPLEAPITISVGLAQYDGVSDISSADIVVRADRALYAAKAAGRNGVHPFLGADGVLPAPAGLRI
jgi:diguanylate cyclase (GGDEF)-like protein